MKFFLLVDFHKFISNKNLPWYNWKSFVLNIRSSAFPFVIWDEISYLFLNALPNADADSNSTRITHLSHSRSGGASSHSHYKKESNILLSSYAHLQSTINSCCSFNSNQIKHAADDHDFTYADDLWLFSTAPPIRLHKTP
jgi:hypothetical protein